MTPCHKSHVSCILKTSGTSFEISSKKLKLIIMNQIEQNKIIQLLKFEVKFRKYNREKLCSSPVPVITKKPLSNLTNDKGFLTCSSSGDRTRTYDLWVMSPTKTDIIKLNIPQYQSYTNFTTHINAYNCI